MTDLKDRADGAMVSLWVVDGSVGGHSIGMTEARLRWGGEPW
ncbi:hypothetical protein [Mycobacterium sp.]|nr:hypothetical protein [Mycobacterium sp.]HTQ21988.1 hypothetical protein [Mycobacterium sp.]